MFDFDSYIRLLREDPKTIVLPEGTDPRVIEAASRLLAGNFLQPILIGEEDAVWGSGTGSRFIISVEPKILNTVYL